MQSTVMCLMAEKSKFSDKPDYAVFADTGWEPQSVYDTLDWLEEELSFPVIRTSNGRSLREDVVNCQGRRKNIPVGRSKSVPPGSLLSINVSANC